MSKPISLTFVQGETVQFPVTITATSGSPLGVVDLSGYTFAAAIRKEYNTSVVENFTVTLTDLPNGQFTLELSSVQTANLPINSKGRITSFVFDVDMNAGGSPAIISTPITGYLKVVHQVTV